MAWKAGWKEQKLISMFYAKDMRVTKDAYRDGWERIFGKRDPKYHTKRSGTRVYKLDEILGRGKL